MHWVMIFFEFFLSEDAIWDQFFQTLFHIQIILCWCYLYVKYTMINLTATHALSKIRNTIYDQFGYK